MPPHNEKSIAGVTLHVNAIIARGSHLAKQSLRGQFTDATA